MKTIKFGILIGLLFFVFNLITLKEYGVSWDEPSNYLKGDRFLEYFLTSNKDYLDFTKRMNVSPFDRPENSIYTAPTFLGHPPIGSLVAAASHKIFTQKLGLLNHVDSHHLGIVFLSSILVSVIYILGAYGTGSQLVGLFSSLLLFTYPRFLAHAHFNPKDVPMTVFAFLAVLFFYKGSKEKSFKSILASSIFFGLAIGSKISIVTAGISLLVWFLIFNLKPFIERRLKLKFLLSLLFYPVISFFVFVSTWPQIWESPFQKLPLIIKGAERLGLNGPDYWQTFAAKFLIRVTPATFLILAFIGLLIAFYRVGNKQKDWEFLSLILILIITPMLRVSMPKANPYDGIRQFFDVVPALCIIGGIGAKAIVDLMTKIVLRFKPLYKNKYNKYSGRSVQSVQLVFFTSLILLPVFFEFAVNFKKHHPYELTYFNPIFGGFPKAYYGKLPYATDYWGGVYKQGVDLLNEKLPEGATLDLPFGAHMIFDYSLRKDIRVCLTDLNGQSKVYPAPGDYIMYYTRQSSYSGNIIIEFCEERLNPIYTIDVDGVPILKVFRNSDEYKKE